MSTTDRSERVTFGAGGRELSGLWSEAGTARAVAAVAHGAGAGMEHPFMEGVAAGLVESDVAAFRFNFPYAEAGRRSPDRAPVLLEAWRGALEESGRRANGRPVVAEGKSLGGRMASMLAAEMGGMFPAVALVFFGYPLHAPGRPEKLRDTHLSSIRIPMLFIQGTADALATFGLVEELVERLGPPARLHPVEGGDHSFRVRGKRRTDEEIGRELAAVAARFVREVIG
jgi:predicted alpha/beta-hydrolase family hydrolase